MSTTQPGWLEELPRKAKKLAEIWYDFVAFCLSYSHIKYFPSAACLKQFLNYYCSDLNPYHLSMSLIIITYKYYLENTLLHKTKWMHCLLLFVTDIYINCSLTMRFHFFSNNNAMAKMSVFSFNLWIKIVFHYIQAWNQRH